MTEEATINHESPFISFIEEDKSRYPFAADSLNPKTKEYWVDEDKDFLIGDSGGFIMNIDFKFINVHLFSEAASIYEKNKKDPKIKKWVNALDLDATDADNRDKYYYCPNYPDSAEYQRFWKIETLRRKRGMSAKCRLKNGKVTTIRITGDHYSYLNYGRILRTPNEQEYDELIKQGVPPSKAKNRIPGFPRFWDGDYWYYKKEQFAENNGFNECDAKARRKGFSFKKGNKFANGMNIMPNMKYIILAYEDKYIDDEGSTTDMVKTNLDFFESSTHWRRFYLSENYKALQLGYKSKKHQNKKFGYKSSLLAFNTRSNTSAAAGKGALKVLIEEGGIMRNLKEVLDITLSTTESGAMSVGNVSIQGTSGEEEAVWDAFSDVFYRVGLYNIMPMENIWNKNARHTVCGFFFPQIWCYEPYIDKNGNSLLREAYEADQKDKELKLKETGGDKTYLIYVGQRANSPEEAFRSVNDNLYNSVELEFHATRLRVDPSLKFYRDGRIVRNSRNELEFKTNEELRSAGVATHHYIEDVPFKPNTDLTGCWRMFFPLVKDANGEVKKGLYYVVYDPVKKDKDQKEINSKNSLSAVSIYEAPDPDLPHGGDRVVATWCGRHGLTEKDDKLVLDAAEYTNGKVLFESDVGTLRQNARMWNKMMYLMKDPTSLLDTGTLNANAKYGIAIESAKRASLANNDLKELLYSTKQIDKDGNKVLFLHWLFDLPSIIELQRFNNSDNFDRQCSLRLIPFVRRYHIIRHKQGVEEKTNTSKSIEEKIGWYGYKNR